MESESNSHPSNKEIALRLNRGGNVGNILHAFKGLMFTCSCGYRITISEFLGYRHSEGVKDQYGITWWIYVRCPKCSYDWALWKIRQKISKH